MVRERIIWKQQENQKVLMSWMPMKRVFTEEKRYKILLYNVEVEKVIIKYDH